MEDSILEISNQETKMMITIKVQHMITKYKPNLIMKIRNYRQRSRQMIELFEIYETFNEIIT